MIYLLRHGQTEYNLEHRIQGRMDSPLTSLGREQAEAMGRTLRQLLEDGHEFEIIASPQERAMTSARLMRDAAGIDRPVIPDARLQEVGCGSWEKHHFASICARDPLVEDEPCFLSAWANYCTDGEGLDVAVERLWGWLCWAGKRDLIVVGHGVSGSILRALYAGEERDGMLRYHSARQDVFHRLDMGWVEEIPVR
ncbi:histidine phosphatase family protein [Alteraurantiacibacter aquimixticola]|nr:histidine phosphatase family protein [Alteraurantiacibacter aquimixticola]